jgi:CheY-like chemotaxis protein
MGREEAGHALRGVYVLLVDSDSRHREILRDILRYCGAWVREVSDAEEGLAVLRETTPTAVVIAVREVGDEAWHLVRGVRAMRPEHGGKLPAVGVGPSRLQTEALAEGFDTFLPEPIEAWRLCGAVAELTE